MNFYQQFIKGLGKTFYPLDSLTGNIAWQWGHEEQDAFDTLKKASTKYSVLCIHDHLKETRVETISSGYGTGPILLQKQKDDAWHLVAFLSQSLNETERK